jgi:hypothetical protein
MASVIDLMRHDDACHPDRPGLRLQPCSSGGIFLASLGQGHLTTLIGLYLFLSSYHLDKWMKEIIHVILPILLVPLAGVLSTYYPPLVTVLRIVPVIAAQTVF